ncbi:MAG: hypothetical protein Q7T54_02495, partial [Candidatus Levybacteria bacterium]|nr:hypothetical protein [Candidatus Levybacteria bacterium]
MNQYLDVIFLNSLLTNILFLPLFLTAVFLAFYIPGRVIFGEMLNDFSKDWLIRLVLPTTLGLVLWAFQGIVFGYLHLRFLTYLYIVAFLFFWVRHYRKKIHIPNNAKLSLKKILRKNILLILLFVIGIFGQNQQFIITAFEFSDGIRGFTGSLDDTFWHTGLIESLVRNFPPIEPGMSGVEVHNYHYWSNVVIAELVRIFHLPLLSTQYLYMGILISFLLGSLAYVLGKQLGFGKMGIFVFVYLQYFSSDVIYLLTFITRQLFIFTIHPLEDGSMLLENTPRAFSFIVLFLGIILVKEWMRSKDKKLGFLIVLIFGCLIGFKVHTGAMGLAGISALCTYLVYKKNFKDLYIGISIVLALIIYLPVNASAGGALFVPFEMTSRNFVVQEGLSLSRLELARRVYLDHGNFLQAFRMDITMLGIYIISQFGVRVIGLIPFRRTIEKLTFPLWLMLTSGVAFTFLFGVLFIQPVAAADIFNSFLAGSFLLSILSAVSFNNWFTGKKKLVQFIFIIVLLICSFPRWVYKTST